MSKSQNKLVGTLYLDLTRLKKDVSDTNALLKTIGTGVNLNMTDVVEKQVKAMLARFKSEIEKTSSETSRYGEQMANGLKTASTQIETLLTTTRKQGADGTLTETRKGFDGLNQSITEVYKNGQVLNKTLSMDSALQKDIQYANQLYQEQIAHLKRIFDLKSQRLSTPEGGTKAIELDKQIADTGALANANKEIIALLDHQAVARSKLVNLGNEEARIAQKFAIAQAQTQDRLAGQVSSGVKEIAEAQAAYQRLTDAYRQYDAAVKSGNNAGRAYWQQNAAGAIQEMQAIEGKLDSLSLEEGARRRLLDLIQKSKDAETAHTQAMSGTNQLVDQMGKRLTQMLATTITLRALTNIWREAISFAREYYDLLNEIRVVSGKTQSQADAIGRSYRKLAKDMQVSATEVAKAAVEYYRQGLSEDEVNRRVNATVKFAKVAAQEFSSAAQIITSATNTMGVSAERVADILAYLGDMSGSGIDEVGIAMTKASSAAMEFGLSLEWLGAYIATVAEKTRQAPEVIGTAINAMLARLHNIKEKGFNEEDATRVNNVAKALATINVQLLDGNNNWRDMSAIFEDIAAKWEGLNGKQRSYIATTMAGTQQQNTFLALMNDMAQGAEGGSRTFELYAGAMNAAGTSAAKFAVWQESVAAAQGKLTAALQSLYALLDAEWMKGFYYGMAGLVELLTAGTDALGGWNLKLPLLIASAGALAVVIYKVVTAINAVRVAVSAANGVMTLLSGGTLGAIAAGVAALVSVVTLITGSIAKATEPVDYANKIDTLTAHRDDVAALTNEYSALAAQQSVTKSEAQRMNSILEKLAGSSMTLYDALTDSTDGFIAQGEAVKVLNGYLLETEARLNNLKREQAAAAFKDLSGIQEAQNKVVKARENENLWREYDKFKKTEAAQQVDFPMYVRFQIGNYADADHVNEQMYWAEIDDLLSGQVDGWFVRTDQIVNALDNLGLSALEASANAADTLEDAWRVVFDSLRVFTEGPMTAEMNPYFQNAMETYFDQMIAGIDREAQITGEKLTNIAADLKAKQEELFKLSTTDAALKPLFDNYYTELNSLTPDVDALNAIIDQINAVLEARNALIESDNDKLPLLPNVDAESLAQIKAANKEITSLSDALTGYFAKQQQTREAQAAAKTLYADEIAELKAAWTSDETGETFAKSLDRMYASNGKLTEGLLETHVVLKDMADGTLSYEEGLQALAEMERLAVKQTQEHTAELIKQAEAEKALEAARKDHYAATLSSLQEAYATGYDHFMSAWDNLSDKAKADIIELYPHVASLASVMGETADGAQIFADALEKAAKMGVTDFTKSLGTGNTNRTKTEQARASADDRYKSELMTLESALYTGGVEAMRQSLFELYDTNEQLYNGLMDTYGMLYRLGDASLTNAQAADVLSDAYRTQVDASIAKVSKMQEQLELDKKLSQSAKNHYADTLRELQSAYQGGGAIGFHEVWNQLDKTAQEYILKTYSSVGNLAVEAVDRSVDMVTAIFDEAIAQAAEMKKTLLSESLTEGADGYGEKKRADEAKENGFQEQLIALKNALSDGTFMEVLAGFGEEMANALLKENEWLNAIIEGLSVAEEGTYNLAEATALLDEHITGTQEQFLANVEAINKANAELLATEEEQISVLGALMNAMETGGIEGFRDAFNALGKEMQKEILDASPSLQKFFKNLESGAANSEDAIKDLEKEINGLNLKKLHKDGKIWGELADAMKDASKGGNAFAKSYSSLINRVEDFSQAMGAQEAIQSGALTKTSDLADAYNVLASYTGISADSQRNNLDPAIWAIASDMDMASNSTAFLCNWLWNTAGVTFSAANWQAQLAALAGSADETTANVARLVETMLQCAGANLSLNGDTIQVNWGKGSYTPPAAKKRGGGGGGKRGGGKGGGGKGGGGGSSSISVSSSIQNMLDQFDNVQKLEDHRRKLAQLGQEYHKTRGEIQGVILYLQKEKDMVYQNNTAINSHIATLESQIKAKQAEVAKHKEGSKKYKQAMADLEALQAAHQQYSRELLQNRNDLQELEQAIDDWHDKIRDMEIELRDLIHGAIMDRERQNRRMLEGRIDIENELLDVLTRRYEKERDQLLELAEAKRDALNEELKLLDERLRARKKLNEQEDRAKVLAEKEAQLARISADPTRKKEELALREEIAKLRESIAWELAEEEVNAQKKAIEQQIESIDDYMEYVETYYKEILSNPRKLIEELQELLTQTDAEIMDWLIQNHEDYQTATDATREHMAQGWQEMLDDMRGNTRTFWDEVESIISQGDEAIIEFLKQNSADYKEAGKLQAEAYVDQWQRKLQDLRNAYRAVANEISSFNYTPPKPSTSSSGSGGGSGGGGSSGSGSAKPKPPPPPKYKFVVLGKTYGPYASIKAAEDAKIAEINKIKAGATTGSSMYGQAIAAIQQAQIIKYAKGGLNTKTGLAWLDGTKQAPERVLSPYQTTLFEDMIRALHQIRVFRAPTATVKPALQDTKQQSFNIDSITVHVEKLDSDTDYEEMAERVGEHIMNKVTRGMSVGGLTL